MKKIASQSGPAVRHRAGGVTVLELLVAVTLVSFIIIALYQMFNRTQEQMRRAINQVDTLETGRALMQIVKRDLGLLTVPTEKSVNPVFFLHTRVTNALMVLTNYSVNVDGSTNFIQTNEINRVFFTSYDPSFVGTNYGGIGYHVGGEDDPREEIYNGYGTLYRYNYNDDVFNAGAAGTFLTTNFMTYASRLADNIVHFKVTPYPLSDLNQTNVISSGWNRGVYYAYTNQSAPTFVEVEIGYLDEETAGIARGFGSSSAARTYLSSHPEKIHAFRFIVPIGAKR
jgi:type II secretory pathway pseudopilin PulG